MNHRRSWLLLDGIVFGACSESGRVQANDGGPVDGALSDGARDRSDDAKSAGDQGPDAPAACAEGALPTVGCVCGGETFDDGFCCGDSWQPNACGSAVTELTDCGLLDRPGTTYRLHNDVQSDGNCFVVKGDNITLDLAGFTVRWSSPDKDDWYYAVLDHPNWTGVPEAWRGGGDRFRVTHGSLTQLSSGDACKDADLNEPVGQGSGTATSNHRTFVLEGASSGIVLVDNRFVGFDKRDFDVRGSVAVRVMAGVQVDVQSAGAPVQGATVR